MIRTKLANLSFDESERIVFFGGAGVSTASGIPDFRSKDGLYSQKYQYDPEVIVSHSFFNAKTAEFYRFYRNQMLFLDAKPNNTHIWLAKHQIPVITQNIDGLHQNAGSKDVYELHGSVHRNLCTICKHKYTLDELVKLLDELAAKNTLLIPKCQKIDCNGIIKPDVVLYEEPLDQNVWAKAQKLIDQADTLIVGGTSLVVYPAASMIHYFKGTRIVVINKSKLNLKANYYSTAKVIEINQNIADVLAL